jgi:hypothetical protein
MDWRTDRRKRPQSMMTRNSLKTKEMAAFSFWFQVANFSPEMTRFLSTCPISILQRML